MGRQSIAYLNLSMISFGQLHRRQEWLHPCPLGGLQGAVRFMRRCNAMEAGDPMGKPHPWWWHGNLSLGCWNMTCIILLSVMDFRFSILDPSKIWSPISVCAESTISEFKTFNVDGALIYFGCFFVLSAFFKRMVYIQEPLQISWGSFDPTWGCPESTAQGDLTALKLLHYFKAQGLVRFTHWWSTIKLLLLDKHG